MSSTIYNCSAEIFFDKYGSIINTVKNEVIHFLYCINIFLFIIADDSKKGTEVILKSNGWTMSFIWERLVLSATLYKPLIARYSHYVHKSHVVNGTKDTLIFTWSLKRDAKPHQLANNESTTLNTAWTWQFVLSLVCF